MTLIEFSILGSPGSGDYYQEMDGMDGQMDDMDGMHDMDGMEGSYDHSGMVRYNFS